MSMRHSARITGRSVAAATAAMSLVGLLGWRIVLSSRPPRLVLPEVVLPEPNGYDTHHSAAETFTDVVGPVALPGMGALDFGNLPPEELDWALPEKRTQAAANVEAFDLAESALDQPIVSPLTPLYDSSLRRLCHLMLVCRSHVAAADGDVARAMEVALDVVEIGHRLELADLGHTRLNRGLQAAACLVPRLDAETARAAAERVAALQAARHSFRDCWQRSGLTFLIRIDQQLKPSDWRDRTVSEFYMVGTTSRRTPLSMARDEARQLFASKQGVIDGWQRYLADMEPHCDEPYSATAPVHQEPFRSMSSARPEPMYERHKIQWLASEALLRQLACALALRGFELDRGRAATSLTELVPLYLPAVPTDPFDDPHPLRYEPGASRLGVHSIGPDGVDNHADRRARKQPPWPATVCGEVMELGDVVLWRNP